MDDYKDLLLKKVLGGDKENHLSRKRSEGETKDSHTEVSKNKTVDERRPESGHIE